MISKRVYKRSKKRDAILSLLLSTRDHPTAAWVYGKLKKKIPGLSLGTVYRNLAALREQGLARSAAVVNGEERFDGLAAPHPHLVCLACGAVADVPREAAEALARAAAQNGLESLGIDFGHTLFYGTCAKCAAQKKARPAEAG